MTPNLLALPPSAAGDDLIAGTIRRLEAGEVVAIPTETVYGLVARADDPAAVERILTLKGRPASVPLTLLAGDASPLAGAALPRLVERAAERYWPGPLTLVVQPGREDGPLALLAHDGWSGVRVPAHDGARAIVEAAPFPLASTSANPHGAPAATDAAGVRAHFDEATLPLVLDGGPAALAESSTVAAVGPGRFEVLREGIVTRDDLARTVGLDVLFVCTGNTCRSPMAEALARHALAASLECDAADLGRFGFRVHSAGVYAGPGEPASEQAVAVLGQRGIDLRSHRSSPAVDKVVAAADRVYCLTASHQAALLSALPPGKGDHVELLDPDGGDVPDPYGGPVELYARTAEAIEAMLARRLAEDWVG